MCKSFCITDCVEVEESDEPMVGLSKLISGCAHNVMRNYETAVENFRRCLILRKGLQKNIDDAHVSAFAQYELGALLLKNEQVS